MTRIAFALCLLLHGVCVEAALSAPLGDQWAESASRAHKSAMAEKKYLFVEFVLEGSEAVTPKMQVQSPRHVFATYEVAKEKDGGWRDSKAFSPLSTRNGVVILDYTGEKGDGTYGKVVSVMPAHKVNKTNIQTLLERPKGTLTQRTMTWAVRVHPQNPQSTEGQAGQALLDHAQRWARKMATESATTRRPYYSGSMLQTPAQVHSTNYPGSAEVLSTTWMGQGPEVTDAATELVGTWHDAYNGQNAGHWGFVLRRWSSYGYDMGYDAVNRMWYACGVAQ